MSNISNKSKSKWIITGLTLLLIMGAAGVFMMLPHTGHGDNGAAAERINLLIDGLTATGQRLVALPLSMLLIPAALLTFASSALIARFSRTPARFRVGRAVLAATLLTLLFAFAIITDRRLLRLQTQVNDLRTKSTADTMNWMNALAQLENAGNITAKSPPPAAPLAPVAATHAPGAAAPQPASANNVNRPSLFFDEATVRKNLSTGFKDMTLRPVVYDRSTDIVQIHFSSPFSQAFLAIVDLTTPGVEITIGGSLSHKSFTSDFARTHACSIAINGEAGNSPSPNSGLGPWQGFLATQGNVILREQPQNPRPFLTFNAQNHASYVTVLATPRTLAADVFNAIWGRVDALVDGQIEYVADSARQPRTAMGINADGSKLYLLVVDGRQPSYSIGYTQGETAAVLKAFGAANAMLCDEGGSSCMYVQRFNGIVNAPAEGEERAVYTHFGISYKPPAK